MYCTCRCWFQRGGRDPYPEGPEDLYVSDPGAGVGGPKPGRGQQADGVHRHSPGVLYRYSLTLITKLLLSTPIQVLTKTNNQITVKYSYTGTH